MTSDAPSNLIKGDVIKTCQHFLLHLVKGLCMASDMEPKLRCTPILLNKVQFTVVLGIIITQVTTRFDIFLELRFLQYEVGVCVKDVTAAASGLSLRMLGGSALDRKPPLRPKAMLADNLFHSLEPSWMMGVVIWKIK